MVNDFYIKFAEVQADPKRYVQLVRYIMNPEAFVKNIEKKKDSQAAAKQFDFIKGNTALTKHKNSNLNIKDRNSKVNGTDFSSALKNR